MNFATVQLLSLFSNLVLYLANFKFEDMESPKEDPAGSPAAVPAVTVPTGTVYPKAVPVAGAVAPTAVRSCFPMALHHGVRSRSMVIPAEPKAWAFGSGTLPCAQSSLVAIQKSTKIELS